MDTSISQSTDEIQNDKPYAKIVSLPPGVGYLDLPKTPFEARLLSYTGIQHPGMGMIGNSLKAHRASNEAIIYLYGATGSGKSSTLNHLFECGLLGTSENESCTKDATEYVVTMNSDPYKLKNLQIGFIDVPGWGDTGGMKQDAINLALISKFNKLHPHLNSNILSIYPNIVLIVVSATDERMCGDESSSARMLRAISYLHIVDTERPNVVFVLTHAIAIPRGRYKEKKKSKTIQLQNLCRQYLGIPAPVVFIENDIEGNGLEKEGDWTQLWDGEMQPLNLFKAMMSVMKAQRDDIGIEAVRIYFSGKRSFLPKPIEKLKVIGDKVIESESQVELNEREINWHKKLKENFVTLVNTEIKLKLEKYAETHPDVVRIQEITPLLYYLQESGFSKQSELEMRTLHQIENQLKPFLLNKMDKFILFEVFKVQYLGFQNLVKVIGCGYDAVTKRITKTPLFDITSLSCDFDYNIGIYIPKCMDIKPLQETVVTCNEISFVTDKTSREVLNETKKDFEFEIEHKIFLINTNKLHTELKNSTDFIRAIEKLPKSAINRDHTLNEDYQLFIEKFGHWMINSAKGSGRITGMVTIDNDPTKNPISLQQVNAILDEKILSVRYFSQGYEAIESLDVNYSKISQALDQAPLVFEGGDPENYCPTLKELNNDKWVAWVQSICNYPHFAPHDFKLSPVYSLAEKIDADISKELQKIQPIDYSIITRHPTLEYSSDTATNNQEKFRRSTIVDPIPITREKASMLALIPPEEQANTCFPGNASVTLKGGEKVRMDEVKIGDYVLSIHPSTGKPVYSKVYLWAHRDPHVTATFLHITHPHGHLHISANHLILSGEQRRPVPAGHLAVGDTIHSLLSPNSAAISVPVLEVHACIQVGYYCPFTYNSFLIVDDVATSVFCVPDSSVADVFSLQYIGHKLFFPLRMIDRLGAGSVIEDCVDKETKIHTYCKFLQDSFNVAKHFNFFFKKHQ